MLRLALVAAPAAMVMAGSYHVVYDNVSNCTEITDIGECQYAAYMAKEEIIDVNPYSEKPKKMDITAAKTNSKTTSNDPTGCFYERKILRMGNAQNSGLCGPKSSKKDHDICLCKSAEYVEPPKYHLKKTGVCEDPVESRSQCVEAALLFGDDVTDVTASTTTKSKYPYGCSFQKSKGKWKSLRWKEPEEQAEDAATCGTKYACVCKGEPEPVEEGAYKLVNVGVCENPVLTSAECQQAAISLGDEVVDDFTVQSTTMTKRPYGCSLYAESGLPDSLKWKDFKDATDSDQICDDLRFCVCKSEPATMEPTMEPTSAPSICSNVADVEDNENRERVGCRANTLTECENEFAKFPDGCTHGGLVAELEVGCCYVQGCTDTFFNAAGEVCVLEPL